MEGAVARRPFLCRKNNEPLDCHYVDNRIEIFTHDRDYSKWMSTRLVYFFLFYAVSLIRLRKRPTEEQEDNTRNEVFYFYKREYKLISLIRL